MKQEKNISVERTTISLDANISKKGKERASKHNIKFSNYIAHLIEQDLNQAQITANNPDLLLKLFEQYQPLLVDDLKAALSANPAHDQKRIMAYTLDALLDYLSTHYQGKASRLAIMPDKTAAEILSMEPQQLAAEDPTHYSKPNHEKDTPA